MKRWRRALFVAIKYLFIALWITGQANADENWHTHLLLKDLIRKCDAISRVKFRDGSVSGSADDMLDYQLCFGYVFGVIDGSNVLSKLIYDNEFICTGADNAYDVISTVLREYKVKSHGNMPASVFVWKVMNENYGCK